MKVYYDKDIILINDHVVISNDGKIYNMLQKYNYILSYIKMDNITLINCECDISKSSTIRNIYNSRVTLNSITGEKG